MKIHLSPNPSPKARGTDYDENTVPSLFLTFGGTKGGFIPSFSPLLEGVGEIKKRI